MSIIRGFRKRADGSSAAVSGRDDGREAVVVDGPPPRSRSLREVCSDRTCVLGRRARGAMRGGGADKQRAGVQRMMGAGCGQGCMGVDGNENRRGIADLPLAS